MESHEHAEIESLLDADRELRELWDDHLTYERQLSALDALSHLSPDEEMERKQIQKLKLAGKDRIAGILARHRRPA